MTRGIAMAALLSAALLAESVTVTYDDSEKVLIDPTTIPVSQKTTVDVPVVNVPVVYVPEVDDTTWVEDYGNVQAEVDVPDARLADVFTAVPRVVNVADYNSLVQDVDAARVLIADSRTGTVYVPQSGATVQCNDVRVFDISSVKVPGGLVLSVQDGALRLVDVATGDVRAASTRLVLLDDGSVRIVDVASGNVYEGTAGTPDVRGAAVDEGNARTVSVQTPAGGEVVLAVSALKSVPRTFYTEERTVKVDDHSGLAGSVSTGSVLLVDVKAGQVYLPGSGTARVDGADVTVVDIGSVKVRDGSIRLAVVGGTLQLVEVATGNVVSANVSVVKTADGKVRIVDVYSGDVMETVVEVPTVYDPSGRIVQWQELTKSLLEMVYDTRSVQHDRSVSPDNAALARWMEIYKSNAGYKGIPGKVRTGSRMIAEARVPEDESQWRILADNLDYYRGRGYDSALMVFYGDEDDYGLHRTAGLIRGKGFLLYIAFGGREGLDNTVFVDPVRLREIYGLLAPLATGCILAWRKTSSHLFIQDRQYTDYLARCARDANPKIELWGEGYYGQTADTHGDTRRLTYITPEYVDGCILTGVGYASTNVQGVMAGLFRGVRNLPRMAVVLGEKPYYVTRFPNGLGFERNLEIKQRIESRFLRQGCCGTITLHGDGSNGVYRKEHTDNLSQTGREQ